MGFDKIKLIRQEKNSGNAAGGRNIGFGISRGKYIFFVDSDDVITNTALEELYNLAEKFNADVVHTERVLMTRSTGKIDIKDCSLGSYNVKEFVTEPTLITEDFFERANDLYNHFFDWNVWTKFIRRDFLAENKIYSPTCDAEDLLLTCSMVCSAKRWLRVPNITYCYRIIDTSVSHKPRSMESHFKGTLRTLDEGLGYLDKFLSGRKFFSQNLEAKYLVFFGAFNWILSYSLEHYQKIPASQLDELFREEFAKFKNLNSVAAFLFNRMNLLELNVVRLKNQLDELKK